MKIISEKPGLGIYDTYRLEASLIFDEELARFFASVCAGQPVEGDIPEEVLAMLEGKGLIRNSKEGWTLGYEGRELARRLGLICDAFDFETGRKSKLKITSRIANIDKAWQEYFLKHDNVSRNLLLEYYLPFVKHTAEHIYINLPDKVELDDLISAGIFGLMDAIDAYDPNRGVKFETYCTPRIRGAILDELRNMDWVPRLIRARHHKFSRIMQTLEASLGRPPSDQEIASELGCNMDEFQKLKCDDNAICLFPQSNKFEDNENGKGINYFKLIGDQCTQDPTVEDQKREIMGLFQKGFSRIEKLIIVLYYFEEMTMKDIGMNLQLSESRVSQIHSSIIARLKAHLSGQERFGIQMVGAKEDRK